MTELKPRLSNHDIQTLLNALTREICWAETGTLELTRDDVLAQLRSFPERDLGYADEQRRRVLQGMLARPLDFAHITYLRDLRERLEGTIGFKPHSEDPFS